VVGDLKRAFPKVQFIATTHSPFIIQSLEPGELIKLDAESDEELARANASVGKSLEDIAESAMDVEVPSRSERFQAMVRTAEEYFRLLHEGGKAPPEELAQAKARLDELSERFSDDPAWVALLRAEREAAGLGEKVQ
jgi:predicted ATP-binding protein involved in virulence